MRMFGMLAAILVGASLTFVAEAIAQRGEEKIVEGQVKNIDPSGTEITLTDGTRLVAPPGATVRPGVLTEGASVIASYTEENGVKVMTDLVMKEPSASPPTGPRTPREPSTAPPTPKRY